MAKTTKMNWYGLWIRESELIWLLKINMERYESTIALLIIKYC